MSAIKKFFQKRKLDVKFKRAGEGHKLTDDTKSAGGPSSRPQSVQASRSGLSEEAARAAEAALIRTSKTQNKSDPNSVTKARMRREMEEEKRAAEEAKKLADRYREEPKEVVKDAAPVLSTILYTCPNIGPAILPKEEMNAYIHQFLLSQLGEEPEMASALMIQTLNKNKEKVKVCVETLSKYLDNLISNPGEEKFRRIRLSNKAFTERVRELEGTDEFLQAVGFKISSLPFEDGETDFYVIDEEVAKDSARLENIKEILLTAEPIKPQLDRNLKVYHPSPSASRFNIPDEFYNVSPAELKREQQARQEATEKLGMLRTKAMRERDERRELTKYRFVLIRLRFPDVLLEGTFKANEPFSCLVEFVRENLEHDWIPFHLSSAGGQKITDHSLTFAELGLAPAAVVNFTWDQQVMAEVNAQQGDKGSQASLKQEVMALIQNL